jgi:SH3-like domain-containing protein
MSPHIGKTILKLCLALLLLSGASAYAQDITRGPETNLPIPRFVSLKTNEANVRRGPSLSHRIDWVFQRRNMPIQVIAEYGHWRRVVDRDGLGGWVHFRLLSGNRTVIIDTELLPILRRANAEAAIIAKLEAGVIAALDECTPDWCRLRADGYRGWAPKSALWGVTPDEIRP